MCERIYTGQLLNKNMNNDNAENILTANDKFPSIFVIFVDVKNVTFFKYRHSKYKRL